VYFKELNPNQASLGAMVLPVSAFSYDPASNVNARKAYKTDD